jgi:hypothetical protein
MSKKALILVFLSTFVLSLVTLAGKQFVQARNSCRYSVGWTYSVLFLAAIALSMLCSGCFLITTESVNKPDAPSSQVKLHKDKDSNKISYSRLFDSQDFDLEVGVNNGPVRWEIGFWFYVLPIPCRYDDSATQALFVNMHLEPKSPQITFDPWQIFVLGTNQVRVPAVRIWQDNSKLGTNTSTTFPVTKGTKFVLEFPPWGQVHPDRGLPLQLSIAGIKASGQSVPMLPIAFVPTTIVRPEFRLPY